MVTANNPPPPVPPTHEELHEMIRALIWARNAPCNCLSMGPQHSFQCVMGGRLMDAALDALTWAVGCPHPNASGGPNVNLTILDEYRKAGGT